LPMSAAIRSAGAGRRRDDKRRSHRLIPLGTGRRSTPAQHHADAQCRASIAARTSHQQRKHGHRLRRCERAPSWRQPLWTPPPPPFPRASGMAFVPSSGVTCQSSRQYRRLSIGPGLGCDTSATRGGRSGDRRGAEYGHLPLEEHSDEPLPLPLSVAATSLALVLVLVESAADSWSTTPWPIAPSRWYAGPWSGGPWAAGHAGCKPTTCAELAGLTDIPAAGPLPTFPCVRASSPTRQQAADGRHPPRHRDNVSSTSLTMTANDGSDAHVLPSMTRPSFTPNQAPARQRRQQRRR